MLKNIREQLRKTQASASAEPAESAESAEPFVKMIAVYRQDGGIKAFVPATRTLSKREEFADSSCEEYTAIMGDAAPNAGSVGWISQTIARFNGDAERSGSIESDRSEASVERANAVEQTGVVQQHVLKLEIEHMQKTQQQQLEMQMMQQRQRQPAETVRHYSSASSGRLSIASMGMAESASEYIDAHPGIADLREVEELVVRVLEDKMREVREMHALEMQEARAEQEQKIREAVEAAVKQINERIDGACAKLEESITQQLQQKIDQAAMEQLSERIDDLSAKLEETISKQLQQKVDQAAVDQLNERIDDVCAELEEAITEQLQQKVDEGDMEERIQSAIQKAKSDVQLSVQQDMDAKIDAAVADTKNAMEQHSAQAIEKMDSKVDAVVALIRETDSKIQQTSETIIEEVDSKIQKQTDELVDEFSEHLQTMKTDIDEFDAKIKMSTEAIEDVTTQVETLKSEIGSFDSKVKKQSTLIIDEMDGRVEMKLNEIALNNDFDNAMEQIRELCNQFESKVVDLVSQECDGKLGVWAMDMEDKLSQDLYRIIEDRVQNMNGNVLKHITSSVDLKLRSIAEPQTEEETSLKEAICKSVEVNVMENVAKEMETFASAIRSDIGSEVQDSLQQMKSLVRDSDENEDEHEGAEEALSNYQPVDPTAESLEAVNEQMEQVAAISKECEGIMERFTGIVQDCETRMCDLTEATRTVHQLNEKAASIIEQIRQSVESSTQQLETSRREALDAIGTSRQDLIGAIRESNVVLGALQSAIEDAKWRLMSQPTVAVTRPQSARSHGEAPMLGQNVGMVPPLTNLFQEHQSVIRDGKQSKSLSNLLCGFPLQKTKDEIQSGRCSITHSDPIMNAIRREPVATGVEAQYSAPSRAMEVKYVNINGQVVKVTQAHVPLNQIGNRVPAVVQAGYYTPNVVSRKPQVHY